LTGERPQHSRFGLLRLVKVTLALVCLASLYVIDDLYEFYLQANGAPQRRFGIPISLTTSEYEFLEQALLWSYIASSVAAAVAISREEKKLLDMGVLLIAAPLLIVLVGALLGVLFAKLKTHPPDWFAQGFLWALPLPVLTAVVLEATRFCRSRRASLEPRS
jgi:hypothetical protein